MSNIFDSIKVSDEVKRFVDHSFEVVDQIHHILEKQGKNQRDLAEMLGKKESEISKWMQGTHNFTLKSIAKIEAVLGENILTTPHKAVKTYSKTTMVPVTVYAHTNNPLISEKISTEATWTNSGSELFKKGLKSA